MNPLSKLKARAKQYADFRGHQLEDWHDGRDHSAAKCSVCEKMAVVWPNDKAYPISGEAVFFYCEGGK